MYAYVSSSYIKNVLAGSGSSGEAGGSDGDKNTPDDFGDCGAITIPAELAGAIEYSAHVRKSILLVLQIWELNTRCMHRILAGWTVCLMER